MRQFTIYNIGKNFLTLKDTYAVEIGCRAITFSNPGDLAAWVADYVENPDKSERDFESRLYPQNDLVPSASRDRIYPAAQCEGAESAKSQSSGTLSSLNGLSR